MQVAVSFVDVVLFAVVPEMFFEVMFLSQSSALYDLYLADVLRADFVLDTQ